MLSIGVPSTLGNWYNLCSTTFGVNSKPTLFIKEKLDKQGADEPVIADEGQLLLMLGNLFVQEMEEKKKQDK